MITIILCAILCGACTVYMMLPVAGTHKRWTYALMVLVPLSSLILYLLLGSPVY